MVPTMAFQGLCVQQGPHVNDRCSIPWDFICGHGVEPHVLSSCQDSPQRHTGVLFNAHSCAPHHKMRLPMVCVVGAYDEGPSEMDK